MTVSLTKAKNIYTGAIHLIIQILLALTLLFTDIWYLESGSMAPKYPAGSFIITSRFIEPSVGSVCAYRHNGIIIVHRIVAKDARGYITKGDANNVTDPVPVEKGSVEGVMLFGIRPVWGFSD